MRSGSRGRAASDAAQGECRMKFGPNRIVVFKVNYECCIHISERKDLPEGPRGGPHEGFISWSRIDHRTASVVPWYRSSVATHAAQGAQSVKFSRNVIERSREEMSKELNEECRWECSRKFSEKLMRRSWRSSTRSAGRGAEWKAA